MSKITTMKSAISNAVTDGTSVHLAGFTHLIPFAAGHEIIRQGHRDLELIRPTPDVVYDRMIAAGCARKVTFSWAGNPGVGGLRSFRRSVEEGVPNEVTIEESTHYGMTARLHAGASGLPFTPLRTLVGSDLPEHIDTVGFVENPFGDEDVPVVPQLTPDVAVVGAQRADIDGNGQLWGIVGVNVEAAFAADTVILVVEEVVDRETIESDPNRTVIPGSIVDYVVEQPYGAHPSYAQGYYERDNEAYRKWDSVSQTHEGVEEWLEEWVYGVANHREYLEKLGTDRLLDLDANARYTAPANVGRY